jgi:uncharacterized protein
MLAPSAPSQAAPGSLRNLIQCHPLAAFFVLAFLITWTFYLIPNALSSRGLLSFQLPFLFTTVVGSYGPTYAALIVTWVLSGMPGIRRLLSGLLIWRVGLRWYLVVLFMHPVLFLLGFGLYALFGGTLPPMPTLSLGLVLQVILFLVVIGLINGEEIGWRGFALPRMQAHQSALTANLILGLIEAGFHLPLFWTRDAPQAAIGPLGFLMISLAAAILFGWVYNNTRGSLLLAYLVHAAQNTWTQVLPVGTSGALLWFPLGMYVFGALLVVIIFGPARLSRKPATEIPTITDHV